MSTRCNVVLKCGSSVVYIYRHYDGYLAETGADLATKIAAALDMPGEYKSREDMAGAFLNALLSAKYEKRDYETEPKSMYELTSELHGDVEMVYYVTFSKSFNTGDVSIRYAARPKNWSEEDVEVDDWAKDAKRYSLGKFIALVNKDREECNARLAELAASSKHYADCAKYPMLEAR